MTDEKRNQIYNMLQKDRINSSLIAQMTDGELEQANSYQDYDEYNKFINYLAYKYDI